MRQRDLAGCVAVALVFAAQGCGFNSGAPAVSSTMEEADVKGTVSVRGRAVNNGTVTFHSANIRRATRDRSAPIQADGSYSIKAYQGQNNVIVNCNELRSAQNRQFREFELDVDVQPGSNTIDIEINRENRDAPGTKAPRRRSR
jgi:hypothetical protein